MRPQFIIILLLTLTAIHCGSIYYSTPEHDATFYQCFKTTLNTSRITTWINTSIQNATVDQPSIRNVATAKSAGLNVQVVYQPCRNWTAEMNIQILSTAFPIKVIDHYWLTLPDMNNTACGWSYYPPSTNCQFLQDLIIKMQNALNTPVGILASSFNWFGIFKDYLACPEVRSSLLWWSADNSNNQPNFDDYLKFGGWDLPYAKLYKVTKFCNGSAFESYYKS